MLRSGMTDIYESCLVSRLSRFVMEMERNEQEYRKGKIVVDVGELTEGIMVLKPGGRSLRPIARTAAVKS